MGYIYKIVDTTTHEYYIGKRQNTNPDTDNYWGSGKNRLCCSAKKHNGANGRYRKDILINGVRNEKLGKLEEILIGDRYETDSLCLNKIPGGKGGSAKGTGMGNTNAKGNTNTKGKKLPPRTDEHKANQSAVMKGKKNALGSIRTAEQKATTSVAMMGKKNALGSVRTAEQNAARSARVKEWWRLKKLKEENNVS